MLASILFSVLISTVSIGCAKAQSLTLFNNCAESIFLLTTTTDGTISNNADVSAGRIVNMNISNNWVGTIDIGTNCIPGGGASKCASGGPNFNGATPFTSAQLNYAQNPGQVSYQMSFLFGYNVGMAISTRDTSCPNISCDIASISQCPVPGPDGSCFSPCCSSAGACANGAPTSGSNGCASLGPTNQFYATKCPAAFGSTFNSTFESTCSSTDATVTLCPGSSSNNPPPSGSQTAATSSAHSTISQSEASSTLSTSKVTSQTASSTLLTTPLPSQTFETTPSSSSTTKSDPTSSMINSTSSTGSSSALFHAHATRIKTIVGGTTGALAVLLIALLSIFLFRRRKGQLQHVRVMRSSITSISPFILAPATEARLSPEPHSPPSIPRRFRPPPGTPFPREKEVDSETSSTAPPFDEAFVSDEAPCISLYAGSNGTYPSSIVQSDSEIEELQRSLTALGLEMELARQGRSTRSNTRGPSTVASPLSGDAMLRSEIDALWTLVYRLRDQQEDNLPGGGESLPGYDR